MDPTHIHYLILLALLLVLFALRLIPSRDQERIAALESRVEQLEGLLGTREDRSTVTASSEPRALPDLKAAPAAP